MRAHALRPPHLFRKDLRAPWIAVVLAALLAFSWQSFVTQTHLHLAEAHSTAAADGRGNAHLTTPSSSDLPGDCPICHEIAHAGVYLLPAPVTFHAPETVHVWVTVKPARVLAVRQGSHAWRSRAPPHQLQA